jgi:hypothetical protein
MDRACSKHRRAVHTRCWRQYLKETNRKEELGVARMIILKWI